MLTHLAYSTLGERRYGEKEGENATLARKKKIPEKSFKTQFLNF